MDGRSRGAWRQASAGLADERGSALIEFTFLSVLLLVPLVYLVLAVFSVQRAAFAVTAATREAGRAFVTTSEGDPMERAQAAAALALRDQGLTLPRGAVRISCQTDCRTPGTAVYVAVDYTVVLPVVPRAIGGSSLGGIPVRGRHTELIDEFRPALP